MRLACGYSKLPRRRGYWNGCSQRDFMGQMLPQVIRQVSVFASALPINELGCVTKCFRFSEQLWPWLSWYVFALPLCHVICGNSPEMFGFCHHPLSSQSDGSLAFLTEIKIAELFISLEARPLGPVWHDFYFFLFYFFFSRSKDTNALRPETGTDNVIPGCFLHSTGCFTIKKTSPSFHRRSWPQKHIRYD